MQSQQFGNLLQAIRPHQWLKNLLVFLPALAAHRVFDPESALRGATAFWSFSLAASSVYLLNDISDRATDRQHPEKKRRPIASGSLSPELAAAAAVVLLGLSAWFARTLPPGFQSGLVAYLVIAGLYSTWLKRFILIDVIALASFYVLRVLAGGRAAEVPISNWFLAFSLFFFFGLGLAKRVTELRELKRRAATQGRGYRDEDVLTLMILGVDSVFASTLVMALYISSDDVKLLYRSAERLWLLLPILLYWQGRFWILANRGEVNADPVVFVARDAVSYAALVCFLGVVAWAA